MNGGMSSRLLAPIAALAALALAGCGSSDQPAPASAPAPSAEVQPATTKSPDVQSADQRKADERALEAWGKAATRACRRLDRDEKSARGRLESVKPAKGARWSPADAERVAKALRPLNREFEREYRALSRIPVPEEEEAAYKVFAFLDKEEEGISLTTRLAADLDAHNDPLSILSGIERIEKTRDNYERAARRVHASECTK
jgi:hypothetical protein